MAAVGKGRPNEQVLLSDGRAERKAGRTLRRMCEACPRGLKFLGLCRWYLAKRNRICSQVGGDGLLPGHKGGWAWCQDLAGQP
jgi:hypothetical protein